MEWRLCILAKLLFTLEAGLIVILAPYCCPYKSDPCKIVTAVRPCLFGICRPQRSMGRIPYFPVSLGHPLYWMYFSSASSVNRSMEHVPLVLSPWALVSIVTTSYILRQSVNIHCVPKLKEVAPNLKEIREASSRGEHVFLTLLLVYYIHTWKIKICRAKIIAESAGSGFRTLMRLTSYVSLQELCY